MLLLDVLMWGHFALGPQTSTTPPHHSSALPDSSKFAESYPPPFQIPASHPPSPDLRKRLRASSRQVQAAPTTIRALARPTGSSYEHSQWARDLGPASEIISWPGTMGSAAEPSP